MADDSAEVREESPVKFSKWQTPDALEPEKKQRQKAHQEEEAITAAYRARIKEGCD